MCETVALNDQHYKQSTVALWSRRILDCKNSGLTVAEWCQQNYVGEKSYWRWHKILKDRYIEYCQTLNRVEEIESVGPEFYELASSATMHETKPELIASLKYGKISADIYSSDVSKITAVCKALMSC